LILVADGLVDAAVEVAKGYRPLDLIPGAFIAEGVRGVAVVDTDGRPLAFGPDADIEELIDRFLDDKYQPHALDSLRKKFIVAATSELAGEIVGAIAAGGRP
jgi:fructose-1,6-bisphosphatase/inositol monophosphatase family enzyme